MRKNIIIVVLSLVVIFLASFEVSKFFFQKQNPTPISNFPTNISNYNWAEILKLNPAQKTKLTKVDKKYYGEFLKLRKNLLEKRMDLCQVMIDPQTEREKLYQRMQDICTEQTAQQNRTIDHLMEIKKLLTPDQQTKFFSIIMKEMCHGYEMECGMKMKDCVCGQGMGHHWK
jgi:Spy/CpxP family protein refolding chaperone